MNERLQEIYKYYLFSLHTSFGGDKGGNYFTFDNIIIHIIKIHGGYIYETYFITIVRDNYYYTNIIQLKS